MVSGKPSANSPQAKELGVLIQKWQTEVASTFAGQELTTQSVANIKLNSFTVTETEMNFVQICNHYGFKDFFDVSIDGKMQKFESMKYHRKIALKSKDKKAAEQAGFPSSAHFKYFVTGASRKQTSMLTTLLPHILWSGGNLRQATTQPIGTMRITFGLHFQNVFYMISDFGMGTHFTDMGSNSIWMGTHVIDIGINVIDVIQKYNCHCGFLSNNETKHSGVHGRIVVAIGS